MKKVTHKMIVASLIGFLIVVGLTFSMLNSVIFSYINRMEATEVANAFQDLDLILSRENENLHRTVLDWAHWDDTYQYMFGERKAEYEESNLQESTLRQLNLNFMFFINMQGDIVYSIKKDLDDVTEQSVVNKYLIKTQPFLKFTGNNDVHSGLLNVDGIVFIITASPISITNEQSPSNGVLIIGRKLDTSLIHYISSISKAEFALTERLDINTEIDVIIEKYENLIIAYKPFKDINGNPELYASLSMPREDYHLGKYYLIFFAAIFSGMLILILLTAIIVFNKYLLKRLTSIHEFIKVIAKTKNTQARLYISGDDEITDIAHSMNEMLAEMAVTYKKKKEIDDRIQTILESTDDGYLEYNLKTKEFYISPKWSRCSDEEKQLIEFDPMKGYMKRIHPDSLVQAQLKFDGLFYGNHDYDEVEYKMISAGGEIIWVLHKGKVIERDDTGMAVRIISILLNITARKNYEEKILKLNCYDKVTGLRNRAFMEEKLNRIDTQQDLKYSIIMGDVNGLKLVNDTFGHKEGDRLIRTMGQILQKVCADDDIIARWGGDEFIILTSNKDENYIGRLMQKIKEECRKLDSFAFKISIALGNANQNERQNVEAVMNLAEERMYRTKLTEVQSSRSATIASLAQTLYEKNHETEMHTQRIKDLALKLGRQIQLSSERLDELELLSLLHDIGKIGIPEHILMKPGKLTDEEWTIIKQHTEIGYRIAKSTPGLFHVAEEILCHHEKFDGTGYPQGLAGEAIPVLSRIIAIVDSFDVMTHKRIYKDAFTSDYAIGELKRCSGTQFDPTLVTEFLKLLEKENIQN